MEPEGERVLIMSTTDNYLHPISLLSTFMLPILTVVYDVVGEPQKPSAKQPATSVEKRVGNTFLRVSHSVINVKQQERNSNYK